MQFRQTGGDMRAFVMAANQSGDEAEEGAVRRAAFASRNDLRKAARQRLSGHKWRVWDAKGLPAAIKARRITAGWWRVDSKAVYVKGRTERVDLLWIFDTGASSYSGKGKAYVAVPLPGQAPIALSGRRYAWPSEAQRMGWELDFARIQGKDSILVLGRRSSFEAWRPLYILKPRTKQMKRLDLDGVYRKHAARLDDYWAREFDARFARALRRVA
jgi:hypothetical protein